MAGRDTWLGAAPGWLGVTLGWKAGRHLEEREPREPSFFESRGHASPGCGHACSAGPVASTLVGPTFEGGRSLAARGRRAAGSFANLSHQFARRPDGPVSALPANPLSCNRVACVGFSGTLAGTPSLQVCVPPSQVLTRLALPLTTRDTCPRTSTRAAQRGAYQRLPSR